MNYFKFFIYQALLTIIGIANDILFRYYLNELPFLNNKFISASVEAPINLVILYFVFKLYDLLKTKLRYKILIHIVAFIFGAVALGLTGSIMDL
ncbi:hypothetical protein BACCIP111895_00187 [Neobacillus rhizosphaerae]|uniref:Uncharacterized protein n=1 Tax=Neobacillus rhizosphaerae TaxID=2880965 RepID=A0ABN8KHZ0_9BACI|nr:hypothetical protein [Neobacillus rhizosphaerae]CAH2713054.1 hypothetical protein BACCIP111895_00187 [Neobacillus rhizosphaerae]